MEVFQPIDQAEEKIANLLQRLGLRPEKPVQWFIENKKHLYSTKCLNQQGEQIFIKVALDNKPRFLTSLKNEANILKYFNQDKELSQAIKVSPYLDSNLEQEPIWFTHQFLPGKKLGEFYDLFETSLEHIKPLVNNLISLQQVSTNHLKKIKSKFKDIGVVKPEKYQRIIKEHQNNSSSFEQAVNFKKIRSLLEKEHPLLEKAPIVLTQGDFTFSNHIVAGNQVYLNDWEWVRFDNFCVDLAHLWIQSWRYPDWQKELLKTFQEQTDKKPQSLFQTNFKMMILIQALNELRWNVKICPAEYKQEASQFCLRTIKKVSSGENLI